MFCLRNLRFIAGEPDCLDRELHAEKYKLIQPKITHEVQSVN